MLREGWLFQQFVVDYYAIIEEARLRYIREHKRSLRTEMYKNVKDAITREYMHGSSIGKRIILPSSFIPGSMYLFEKYQDRKSVV